jgi:hypothetical protein
MKILFVHHSIGRYCINAGLKSRINKVNATIELWDIDYKRFGLRDGQNRRMTSPRLEVPNDNTNPDGLRDFVKKWFITASESETPNSIFNALILKSCYTGARIRTDEQLANYIDAGIQTIRMLEEREYPTVILTPVPDSALHSSAKVAMRAKKYAERMKSEAQRCRFVHVVNLHEHLANEQGFLRTEFRKLFGLDAHPNTAGINTLCDVIQGGLTDLFALTSLKRDVDVSC